MSNVLSPAAQMSTLCLRVIAVQARRLSKRHQERIADSVESSGAKRAREASKYLTSASHAVFVRACACIDQL